MAVTRYQVPGYDLTTSLFTFEDAVDHLMDVFDIVDQNQDDRQWRNARRAVDHAYRDLPRKHRWKYYERWASVETVAPQSSGTVSYDSSNRQVTLSGATWPSWAVFGNILLENQRYKISERVSDTVIKLPTDSRPEDDISGGTAYTIMRAHYPLPVNFRRAGPLVDIRNSYRPSYIPPGELPEASVAQYQPQQPWGYTFLNAGEYYGSIAVEFVPPPVDDRTYHFMMEVEPRALRTYQENAGTVSITAGQTTVSGSSTAFADKHIGSVIRFSPDGTTKPTGIFGAPDGTDNPYTAQRVVMSVDNATSLEVDSTVASTLSAVKYNISDPLDIESGAMTNLVLRLAELYYMKLNREFGPKRLAFSEREAREALRLAMGSDNRSRDIGPTGGRDRRYYDLADWAIAEAFEGTVIS